MFKINEFVINEYLVKAAVPHIVDIGKDIYGFPPVSTQVHYTDGTTMVLLGVDVHMFFREWQRSKGIE